MKKHILRSCTIVALGLAATQVIVSAQEQETPGTEDVRNEAPRIEGVWNVSVTVRDCQSGNLIRNIRALNLFVHDGSLAETAANFLRTPSLGTWRHIKGRTYTATFRFFRYDPDGTFASLAKATRTIELSRDADQFTSTGTVEDFDAHNFLISTACATEEATRVQ